MDGENHGKLVDKLCQQFDMARLDAFVKRVLNRPLEHYAIANDLPSIVDKFVSELERRPVELEKFLVRLRSLEKETFGCDGDSYSELLLHAPRPLAEHLRVGQFRALIAERTSNFVGREFIFNEITRLLTDVAFSSGYIIIRGEPGIGKTSVIAELVRRHGYVHHFNDRRGNIRSHRHFLGSVCAQLILRYELNHRAIPSGALEDNGFLHAAHA